MWFTYCRNVVLIIYLYCKIDDFVVLIHYYCHVVGGHYHGLSGITMTKYGNHGVKQTLYILNN